MKLKNLFTFGFLFIFTATTFAQSQKELSEVKATSWQFSKMAYATHLFIDEAASNRDSDFLVSAQQHLIFTENNLEELKGKISASRYKDAKQITDLLDTILSRGLNLNSKDAVALLITERKIDEFVEGIFSNVKSE